MDHVNATPLLCPNSRKLPRCNTGVGLVLAALMMAGCGLDSTSSPSPTVPPPVGGQPPTGSPPPPPPPSSPAPVSISGTPPAQAAVGQSYSFTPQVTGGQGGRSFQIQNLPDWANFNSGTGRISGTPGNGNVAMYAGIRITVTDNTGSATLGPFGIEVVGAGTASVTLSWQAPTERADGTPLQDLAGFRIFYGQSSDDLDTTIDLSNPGLARYVVENLTAGTSWFFAMTAYDQAGLQSTRSPTVEARL